MNRRQEDAQAARREATGMNLFFRILAVCSGLTLALQPAINARLRTAIGSPFWAAITSFVVGTVALFAVALVLRAPLPHFSDGLRAPWYVWTGGVFGAIYVATTIVVIPRLGAAQMLSLAVLGMMLGALLIDRFGLFGLELRPFSIARILGAAFVVAGVTVMTRY